MRYRYYITDALKVIGENTANIGGGSHLTVRFYELLHPAAKDDRTGDEIVDDVLSKICFSGGEKG